MRFLMRFAVVVIGIVVLVSWVRARRHRRHPVIYARRASTIPMARPSPPPDLSPTPPIVDVIATDRTLARGTSTFFPHSVRVKHGATLRVEPGAHLEFAPNAQLSIEGTLIARGTEEAPIVFQEQDGVVGDWAGIVFTEDTMSGSIVEHAEVRHAGVFAFASIAVHAPPRAVTIAHVDITGVATAVYARNPFAAFHDNELSSAHVALDIDPDAMGSIGTRNHFNGSVQTSGRVTRSQKWPKLDVPIVVNGILTIDGIEKPAVLELADETDLQFAGGELRIGKVSSDGAGGALIAKNAMFGKYSTDSWSGISFFRGAAGTRVEGCVVADAPIGIVFHGGKKDVIVRDTTFLHVEHAFHSVGDLDCGPFVARSMHNKTIGAIACRLEPLTPSEDH